MITRAVIEQTMTVSMKGSSMATKPWVSGSFVRTAAWAIEDEPTPASLEKAARRKPSTTTPSTPPAAWKQVEADGVSQLDGEAFVAMNRFSVVEGSEDAFEARFANRESTLASFDGFKGFMLLRREGAADDGFTHSTWSLWRDRAAFEVWRDSEKRAGKPKPAAGGGGPPPNIFVRPPVPTFYESILVLESAKGV